MVTLNVRTLKTYRIGSVTCHNNSIGYSPNNLTVTGLEAESQPTSAAPRLGHHQQSPNRQAASTKDTTDYPYILTPRAISERVDVGVGGSAVASC